MPRQGPAWLGPVVRLVPVEECTGCGGVEHVTGATMQLCTDCADRVVRRLKG